MQIKIEYKIGQHNSFSLAYAISNSNRFYQEI